MSEANTSGVRTDIPKERQIQVAPMTPRFVNYLRVPIRGSNTALPFDVGGLSDEDAGRLWEAWKAEWIAHVRNRRDNL
jgi:hypothetical protein